MEFFQLSFVKIVFFIHLTILTRCIPARSDTLSLPSRSLILSSQEGKPTDKDIDELYKTLGITIEKLKIDCFRKKPDSKNGFKSETSSCHTISKSRWTESDVKSLCCRIWEFEICLQRIVDKHCSQAEITELNENKEVTERRQILQEGYCDSYRVRSDCDFPVLMVFAIASGVVVLVIVSGYAIMRSLTRN
ncbi:uncharacterized protein LOC141849196 [Brevipalpus obovatus]|uniref:uncharacterized protein LOC141849196 n=1 Tax=Brevipalpus obovatus TaxID=246614 RepID=UPI003D9E4416